MSATFAEFLADGGHVENWTFEQVGYDLLNDVARTLYFCTDAEGFATEPGETPASQLFEARMHGGVSRTFGIAGGDRDMRRLAGYIPRRAGAEVTVAQSYGDLDRGTAGFLQGTPIRSYAFGGRASVVKFGGRCNRGRVPYASYRQMVNGVCVGQPKIGPDGVTFRLQGNEGRLDSPVQAKKFWGTRGCAVFDGVDDFIDCGNDAAFNYTTAPFSLTFMVFMDAYPGTDRIFWTRGATDVSGFSLAITTTGAVRFRTNQLGVHQDTVSDPLPLHGWVEVELSIDVPDVAIYVDCEDAVATAGTHTAPASSVQNLFIGKNNAGTDFFPGALDELRWKDGASTEEDFEAVMHRPLSSLEVGDYLGYWNFNDGEGSPTLINLGTAGSAGDGAVTGPVFVPSCMGGADLQGKPMPDVWGECYGVTPVCVDFATQLYLVHSSKIEELLAVRLGGYADAWEEDGSPDTAWLTWIVGSTDLGEYKVCNADGWTLFRAGGQPNKKVTVDVKGDKSDGTYRNTVAALDRYIASTRGAQPYADPSEIDDATFDAFDAANPQIVGLSYSGERSVQKVVDQLSASLGAIVWPKRGGGQLTIAQLKEFTSETAVMTLDENYVAVDGDNTSTLDPQERGNPSSGVVVRYRENPTVMGDGDLFESLDAASADFCKRQWRQVEKPAPLVARWHLDAKPATFETCLVYEADAVAEAARRNSIMRKVDQGLRFLCAPTDVRLDFMDPVIFYFRTLDEFGALQARYGTSSTSLFWVVGIEEQPDSGGFLLDLWRPGVV